MKERTERLFDDFAKALGPKAVRNAALGELTTYRVGGGASILFTAESKSDLEMLRSVFQNFDAQMPVLVVGNGSNLLIADLGFRGLAITLGKGFETCEFKKENEEKCRVVAGSSVSMPVLARRTVEEGLSSFEWAVGVPGSVGGGVAMNAGGHGSDIAATLFSAQVFDLQKSSYQDLKTSTLSFSYRTSAVKDTDIVTEASFVLTFGDKEKGREKIAEIVRWRRANQPGGSNAGSVFRNPIGDAAGRLIEAAGAKGLRIGSAEVSRKHANFIQLDKGGLASDVNALIEEVRRRVKDQFGADLVTEVRRVGFEVVDNGGDGNS